MLVKNSHWHLYLGICYLTNVYVFYSWRGFHNHSEGQKLWINHRENLLYRVPALVYRGGDLCQLQRNKECFYLPWLEYSMSPPTFKLKFILPIEQYWEKWAFKCEAAPHAVSLLHMHTCPSATLPRTETSFSFHQKPSKSVPVPYSWTSKLWNSEPK